jgi:hypothetical protein
MKGLVRGAVGFVLLLMMSRAAAAAESSSVVVIAEGPDARVAREEITSNLGDGFVASEPTPFTSALAGQGQKGALGTQLATPNKRKALFDKIHGALAVVRVDDVVVVVTTRTRSGRKLASAYVVDASGETSPEIKSAVATPNHSLADAVSAQLKQMHPPPPPVAEAPKTPPPLVGVPGSPLAESPSSEPAAQAEDRSAAAGPGRPKHRVGREWLEADAGFEGGMRHFTYHDGITKNLRDYQLSAAPLVALDGALYPFANSGAPVMQDFGLILGYAQAFAVQSMSDTAGKLDTQWQRFYAGGRARARLGSSPQAVILEASGAYGGESFFFDSTSTSSYPSVEYRFVQTNASVRVPIGRFAAMADGGYLFVLTAGDVASRFPRSSVGGIDARVGGAFTLGAGFEARLMLSYRRFFYSMNPVPGDALVAGGALDQFWGLSGSLAYVY